MPSNHKKISAQVWGASPAGTAFSEGAEPGTKEFFDKVFAKRASYEMPWLPEAVPFSSFRGKKVLELGCGAGYDAYVLCANDAGYTGLDIAPENPKRTRRHLGFFGFAPNVLEGDAEDLPFAADTFEVVYSNGVLHHTPDISKSFSEAYRVLKNGGEFWVLLYHRDSLAFWLTMFLYTHVLRGGFLKRNLKQTLSRIEHTTSGERPLVNVYSRRQVKNLFAAAGFGIQSVRVRKLLHEDLPLGRRLWRPIPQRWLDWIGKAFGWYIIVQGIKAR